MKRIGIFAVLVLYLGLIQKAEGQKSCDFACGGSSGPSCIPSSWVCDGQRDCSTNLDETEGCCSSNGMFWCRHSLQCIDTTKICNGNNDCRSDAEDEQDCSHVTTKVPATSPPSSSPQIVYDIRLVGDPNGFKGRLEIYYSGQWGTVCDDSFGMIDAKVVCRQLGSERVLSYSTSWYPGIGPIWMDDLACSGLESRLADCSHRGWGSNNCGHQEDIFIECEDVVKFNVRLVDGPNPWEGRLEVYYNDMWGTVCDDLFNEFDAEVACWQLGYSGVKFSGTVERSGRASSATPIWLDDVQCSGGAYRLWHCSHGGFGKHDCDSSNHEEDVYLICHNTIPHDGDLRLVNGSNEWEGRLEIYHDDQWGAVAYNFNTDKGNVACWQLGYTGVSWDSWVSSYDAEVLSGYKTWLDDVHCFGTETRLDQCSHTGWCVLDYCSTDYYNIVYLHCINTRNTPPKVKGCPNDVNAFAEQGTYDTAVYWAEPIATDAESHVTTIRSHKPGSRFPLGITHVAYLFKDLPGKTVACSFSVLVETAPFELRLDSGENIWEGRLEIYYNETWGTVCTDSFGEFEAEVACWQLGYTGASAYRTIGDSERDLSGTPIWLDDVDCSGEDYRLWTCSHRDFGSHDCDNSTRQDVYLICHSTKPLDGDLSLVGVKNEWEGRLEVYHNDRWGTVCSTNFDYSDATVACLQLGYAGYTLKRTASSGEKALPDYKIWLDNVDCSGNETRLDECNHMEWGISDCSVAAHDEDVFLVCERTFNEPPVVTGCPDDVRAFEELGTSETIVFWTEPSATDESDIELVQSHFPGSVFPLGTTHIAYIYHDQQDLTSACSFSVIVEKVDTTAPSVTFCPNDVNTITELGTNGTMAAWKNPTASDLSGTPRMVQSHPPWSEFPVGETVVTYVFVDTSNNTANCSFTVTVDTVDTTPPNISKCPSNLTSIALRQVYWTEPTAFDLSGNITTWSSHSPGMYACDNTEVVYSFTDPSKNVGFCRFMITSINDNIPPTINGCPNDTYADLELGTPAVSVFWNWPTATDDNNRAMLIHATHAPGELFFVGTTFVEYTFSDDSYNEASCNFSVIVNEVSTRDAEPPEVINCPSDISVNSTKPTNVSWTEPTTDDESTVTTLVKTNSPGDLFEVGSTTVIYLFSDQSNNIASCTFVVRVRHDDTYDN